MSRTNECPVVRQLRKFGFVIEFEGEFHVLSRERLSVVPPDIVAQADPPLQAVLGNAAVLLRRHLRREVRLDNAFGIDPEERVEKREMDTVIDLDMCHQRIKDRGLLREPDDNPALGTRGAFWPRRAWSTDRREDAGCPA